MSNPSGISPVEFKVLIKQELSETERRAEASGLALPPELREREAMAGVRATLLAIGGNAYEDWKGLKPKPGDRVYTAKYSGIEVIGEDGGKYRLINDRDVLAIIGGAS